MDEEEGIYRFLHPILNEQTRMEEHFNTISLTFKALTIKEVTESGVYTEIDKVESPHLSAAEVVITVVTSTFHTRKLGELFEEISKGPTLSRETEATVELRWDEHLWPLDWDKRYLLMFHGGEGITRLYTEAFLAHKNLQWGEYTTYSFRGIDQPTIFGEDGKVIEWKEN